MGSCSAGGCSVFSGLSSADSSCDAGCCTSTGTITSDDWATRSAKFCLHRLQIAVIVQNRKFLS